MILINTKFLTIPEDKQDRIIRAALGEFGRYGYAKTSVEQIAKAAGISKGMVFHYFGTKAGLYEYLIEYCDRYIDEYYQNSDEFIEDVDYIEMYRIITKIKLKAYTRNRSVFEFLTMIFLHPENSNVTEKVTECVSEMAKKREVILSKIRNSKVDSCFRSDIKPEEAKRYINWLIEGYSQELIALIGDKPLAELEDDNLWDEFDEIMLNLKKIFYTHEGGSGDVDD